MKVLIISDTHGYEQELLEVKHRYEKEVDMMIHCGDSELPLNHSALENFYVVRGNCDNAKFPNDLVQQVLDLKLFVTHGHLYNVKMSLMNLQYRAEELCASIICFGHSHLAGSELINNKLYINPGSYRLPRGIPQRTYCIIEVENNKVDVQFLDHEHNKVPHLSQTFQI